MDAVHFVRPELLMSLWLLVPAVIGLWFVNFKMRAKAREKYGEPRLVDRYTKPLTLKSELFIALGWVLVTAFIVVAAAGPVTKALPTRAQSGTLQVIVVTDVSKSMRVEDYRHAMPPKNGLEPVLVPGAYGSRLDMVKRVVETQVMPAIQGNELEIIVYTGEAVSYPDFPTDDLESLRWIFTHWVKIGNAPGGGSDYAMGLIEAIESFKRSPDQNKERVIVLFSDGGFTGKAEDLQKAADEIKKMGIRLIIVGVGSPENGQIPEYSKSGELTGYLKLKEGDVTALQESNLTQLQALTGGEYLKLEADSKLEINWASTLAGSKTEDKEDHVFFYPAGAAFLLLTLLFMRGLLPVRRR